VLAVRARARGVRRHSGRGSGKATSTTAPRRRIVPNRWSRPAPPSSRSGGRGRVARRHRPGRGGEGREAAHVTWEGSRHDQEERAGPVPALRGRPERPQPRRPEGRRRAGEAGRRRPAPGGRRLPGGPPVTPLSGHRRVLLVAALGAAALLMLAGSWMVGSRPAGAAPAAGGSGSVSRRGRRQLSHNPALERRPWPVKAGPTEPALELAQSGYLRHFEWSSPLLGRRSAAPPEAEKVRRDPPVIRFRRPDSDGKDRNVALRGLGPTPRAQAHQPRPGRPRARHRAVVPLSFLEALRRFCCSQFLLCNWRRRRPRTPTPILGGVAAAVAATVVTAFLLQAVPPRSRARGRRCSKRSRVVAVAMLFWVSFWLISRSPQALGSSCGRGSGRRIARLGRRRR